MSVFRSINWYNHFGKLTLSTQTEHTHCLWSKNSTIHYITKQKGEYTCTKRQNIYSSIICKSHKWNQPKIHQQRNRSNKMLSPSCNRNTIQWSQRTTAQYNRDGFHKHNVGTITNAKIGKTSLWWKKLEWWLPLVTGDNNWVAT